MKEKTHNNITKALTTSLAIIGTLGVTYLISKYDNNMKRYEKEKQEMKYQIPDSDITLKGKTIFWMNTPKNVAVIPAYAASEGVTEAEAENVLRKLNGELFLQKSKLDVADLNHNNEVMGFKIFGNNFYRARSIDDILARQEQEENNKKTNQEHVYSLGK